VFYLHPWEVDPEIPKMNKVSALSRLEHIWTWTKRLYDCKGW
jgi:hypothetical protein